MSLNFEGDSVIKENTLLDDGTASTPQEDFPSDVVTKIHHEPILDKDKSKYDTSATSKYFLFYFNFS
jgi:hypothetical protein